MSKRGVVKHASCGDMIVTETAFDIEKNKQVWRAICRKCNEVSMEETEEKAIKLLNEKAL